MNIKNVIFQRILPLVFSLLHVHLLAQKNFDLTIRLPDEIDKGRIQVYLDDGKDDSLLKLQPSADNNIVIKGKYYSIYAIIGLQYQKGSEGTDQLYGNRFFIQDKPALIQLYPSDSTGLDFEKYILKNVWDFKLEKLQMANYDSAERREGMAYEAKYGEIINSGKDRAISDYYFQVVLKAQRRKKLEYIVKNPNSYYSFWSFRTDIAWRNVLAADSLLLIFNSVIPDKFRNSDEGNFLNELIHAKLSLLKPMESADFITKDSQGKSVVLSGFRDKKFVLLHFWATWCSPCMAELPVVKEISKTYAHKDLQIISIAAKSTLYDFNKVVKSQQLEWIQIYDDQDLERKFGNLPVPRLCLIDKSGKVIYDNAGLNKKDDLQLGQLKQVLESTIK